MLHFAWEGKEFSTSYIHWSIETSMDVVVDNTKLVHKLLLLINIDQIIFFLNFILCKCCFFLHFYIDHFVHGIKHPSSLILIDVFGYSFHLMASVIVIFYILMLVSKCKKTITILYSTLNDYISLSYTIIFNDYRSINVLHC